MLSKKSKLCVKVLVVIASAPPGEPVTALTLSNTLHVATSNLESVARILREGGFIKAARGPGGGYYLNGQAASISVWDVVKHADPAWGGSEQASLKTSPIGTLEQALSVTLIGYLSGRTIDEFVSTRLLDHTEAGRPRFGLRPMPRNTRPSVPSFVFDLSSFPRMKTA